MRRPVRSATVGATCLTKTVSVPTGVHSRRVTSATSLPIASSIIRVKSAARPAGSATMSAEPSRAEATAVTSFTSQSVPTPRASQVNRPAQASRAARRSSGDSCSLRPSVSSTPCRMSASAAPSSRSASRSQVPIAVPPPALSRRSASFAWALVCTSAVASRPLPGYTSSATCVPATTANRVPSRRVSTAAAVASRALRIFVGG